MHWIYIPIVSNSVHRNASQQNNSLKISVRLQYMVEGVSMIERELLKLRGLRKVPGQRQFDKTG